MTEEQKEQLHQTLEVKGFEHYHMEYWKRGEMDDTQYDELVMMFRKAYNDLTQYIGWELD